jgi:hypothetical protein
MHSSFANRLSGLAEWRQAVGHELALLGRFLAEHDLLGDAQMPQLLALRQRLASEKLTVAFVAEFSRGKSELINAILFADAGRRILPATPGRTTMCPVEMGFDPEQRPELALLPIETRLQGLALVDLRGRTEPWSRVPLDPSRPEALAQALAAVTRTRRVDKDTARALGFWNDDTPHDNPPIGEDGLVEVPAWRHALINFPHPLLQRGLVVLDTPGLNAIGAEPELTLGLLPSAHATVFVLGADTGVTRSDLDIWREHLSGKALERFVVLNKIDALQDPLQTPAEVEQQIELQVALTADTLGLPKQRVFALSARNALAARVKADVPSLLQSRLPDLEAALAGELLPRQRELLHATVQVGVQGLKQHAERRITDRRRQIAEQLLELRGLRGKSGARVQLMLQRLDAEMLEFETCTQRMVALRAVHAKQLRAVLAQLSSDVVRREVAGMTSGSGKLAFALRAEAAFGTMVKRLRAHLGLALEQAQEMHQMWVAGTEQLNTQFGFALAVEPLPDGQSCRRELAQVERNTSRYLSLTQSWRLALPGFAEQFRRLLTSRLRVAVEAAASEFELWSKGATGQWDVQLRERREVLRRRRVALERMSVAAGELEERIAEVQAQEAELDELHARVLTQCLTVLQVADDDANPVSRPMPLMPGVEARAA